MVVISVEVPDRIAKKFSSDKVIKLQDLSAEEQLLNLDWEWWNDSFVNMDSKDFLVSLKNDVINYNI